MAMSDENTRQHEKRPGRFGVPDMQLRDDPRVDPRLLAALAVFEMDRDGGAPPVSAQDPLAAQLEFLAAAEPAFEGMFEALASGLDLPQYITRETVKIPSSEGHQIKLFIHRPANTSGSLVGILHLHGGGMAILSAAGPIYSRWRDLLAAQGHVVVGVEFRNAAGELGTHPYPAGLNDCTTALKWMDANRTDLGLSKIVVSGDAGGGNLTLAVAMKAKKDSDLSKIAGLYAMAPFISNVYNQKPKTLPSLVENDTYFVHGELLAVIAAAYDGSDSTDPLAWPWHATTDYLKGLPPTVISVNEMDPLRDEGAAFYNALVTAGVNARLRQVDRTTHAADVIFQGVIPDIAEATITDLCDFVASL